MSLDLKIKKSQAGGVQLIEFSILPEYKEALKSGVLQINLRKIDSRKRKKLLQELVEDSLPEEILDEIKGYYEDIRRDDSEIKSVYHIHNLPVINENEIPKSMPEGKGYHKAFIINEVVKGIILSIAGASEGRKIEPYNLVRRKRDGSAVNIFEWHMDNYKLSTLAGVVNKGGAKTKFADVEQALERCGIVNYSPEIDKILKNVLSLIEIHQPKNDDDYRKIINFNQDIQASGITIEQVEMLAKVWPAQIKRFTVETQLQPGSCLFWPNYAIFHRADPDNPVHTASLRDKDITRVAVFQGIKRD